MVLSKRLIVVLFLAVLVGLSACSPEGLSPLNLPEEIQSEPKATPVPSPVPPQVFSICLGKEPDSLFLYGDLSRSADIIRQAIYDGPIDKVDYQYQAVILEELPSQGNGLVSVDQIEVFPGERMVDARGNLTILTEGVEFKPADCADPECWEVYDNQPSIFLDQVAVRFQLSPGLRWSDGAPLSPQDSLFSYQIAGEVYGSRGPARLRFAADYQVLEGGAIQWTGLPGYLGIYDYAELFFSPLPEHLWSSLTQEELFTSSLTNLYPLGWGAYRVLEWVKGDHLTLERNEYYRLASQGWPAFDYLVFRFVGGGEEALAAYSSGECDLVANTPDLINYYSEMLSFVEEDEVILTTVDQSAWEQISFGIDSLDRSRQLLDDPQLRNALARCINRELIAARRKDTGTIADNLYHPLDPRYNSENPPLEYQPGEGETSLNTLGWVDHDQDPATGRRAEGVSGVPWGTTLELSLLVPGADGESSTAEMIKEQLLACGVEVEIEALPPSEMLAAGPEGPVFGRQFDLALFSWTTGSYHLGQIFQTAEIPGEYPAYAKGWGGANATGYSNPAYDLACNTALTNLPDSEATREAVAELQTIFREELPVLPLFYRQELILSHPSLEGIQSGSFLPLWNIERIKLLD